MQGLQKFVTYICFGQLPISLTKEDVEPAWLELFVFKAIATEPITLLAYRYRKSFVSEVYLPI